MKLVRILCKFVRFRIDSGRSRIEGIFLLEQNKKRKKKEKRGFIVTGWRRGREEESGVGSVGREIELTLATMHLLAMFTWSVAFLRERDTARTRAVANTVIIAWHARERVACAQWQRTSAGGARESGQPCPLSPSTLSWIRTKRENFLPSLALFLGWKETEWFVTRNEVKRKPTAKPVLVRNRVIIWNRNSYVDK